MTDVAGIVVRYALYLDLMLLFGLPAFALYAPTPGGGDRMLPRSVLGLLALAGLGLSAVAMVIMAATMSGTSIAAVEWSTIKLVADTTAGSAWKLRAETLGVVLIIGVFGTFSRIGRLIVIALAGVALATLAWTGHGAMDDGPAGIIHLAADIGHLLAAGIWIGALVALLILQGRARRTQRGDDLQRLHRALAGFEVVGTGVVGVIVATGLVNAWLLVGPGNVATLGRTLYGQLLIAKLLLFSLMLGLASLNRFRLTPSLDRSTARCSADPALGAFQRSLAAETLCAVMIFGLVAWLGTLAPPASGL